MTQTRYRFTPTVLNTPEDFLRLLQYRHGWRSLERVAAELNVNRQTIYNYRDGKTGFNAATCKRVAELLDLPYEFVLGKMDIYRAPTEEEKAARRRLLAKLKATAAAVVAAVGISGGPTPPSASASGNAAENPVRCVLCKTRRRRWHDAVAGAAHRLAAALLPIRLA